MYNQNNNPNSHYNQHSYDENLHITRQQDEDSAEGPVSAPPFQFTQAQIPQPFFTTYYQPGQLRARLCNCLGNWGLMGLRRQAQFGRDFWFFPTAIRRNSVTGYIWMGGRRQRARFEFSQIRNFICLG